MRNGLIFAYKITMPTETLDKAKLRVVPHEPGSKTVIEMFYDNRPIATSFFTDNLKSQIQLSFESGFETDEFIVRSLLRCTQIEAEQFWQLANWEMVPNNEFIANRLGLMGGRPANGVFTFQTRPFSINLIDIKHQLSRQLERAEAVGRGFYLSGGELPNECSLLLKEYNDIAWGFTEWARHTEPAKDEVGLIKDHVKGKVLEVGAGSGRLTEEILKYTEDLTALDYLPEITEKLKQKVRAKIVTADILDGDYTEEFDTVVFLENGLGSFLLEQERKKAAAALAKAIRPAGKLLLGVRQLPKSPCDQLMLTTQNPHLMGVYHTFSDREVLDLFLPHLTVCEIRKGDVRPAGGFAKLFVFKK